MLLRDFIKKYPNDSLDMMTPGGFVFLTPEQAKNLVEGKDIRAHPGNPEYAMAVSIEELLSEPVESARWEKHVCHMVTGYPVEEGQAEERAVMEMTGDEQERRLKERLKANYETYIRQLQAKPAADLIEMASEIAAAKFIYEELEMEGLFTGYADYLLQFETPLEVLIAGWVEENSFDRHEELDHMLWNMAAKSIGVGEFPTAVEDAAGPTLEQGVAMC